MVDLNIKLPDSFFLEEERDGYLVSAKMKELWAVQLDLLNEFDRVCKKHNLKYILDFGTLLGAVRHKGFIPWDDDLDVSMLREDYDKLMEVGPTEFKHPYFLQNKYTEKNYVDFVTKLRRTDTAYILKNDINEKYKLTYNKGIFIDIFVFDNIPSNNQQDIEEIKKVRHQYADRWFTLSRRPRVGCSMKHIARILRFSYYRLLFGTSENAYKKHEEWARHLPSSDYVATIMLYGLTDIHKKKWFDNIKYISFETLTVPSPIDYDEMLTEEYGDYMVPVRCPSDHTVCYINTETSYQDITL